MQEGNKSPLERWKERFRRECPTQFSEALKLAGKPVTIFRANETGEWAVAVSGSEFWMDAFDTEAEAEAFVKEVGWPIDDDF